MDKKYYINLFESYPDVVDLEQFREMLGGIADSTARKLIHENRVKHYNIRNTYLIPKDWVVEYVLSKHYASYKRKLKAHI
jgi:excisionase family DNA binding protein